MEFNCGGGAGGAEVFSCPIPVPVKYKDRVWEINLKSRNNNHDDPSRETSLIALDLQAALNLERPPVGLRLRVAPGADAVLCPLSVLVVCPSYIGTAFQGMSWTPLLEGEGDEDEEEFLPCPIDPLFPSPLGSPSEPDMPISADCGFTASSSEGCGRPLTAPPGDRTRGVSRRRPGRREGLGRPMSATPSDKSCGMRRFRPGKSEGFGRPVTALPSDHSGSESPAWGLMSPHGFQCEENAEFIRPSTAPAFAITRCALTRCAPSGVGGSRSIRSQQLRVDFHQPEQGGVGLNRFNGGSRATPESSDFVCFGGAANTWAWHGTGPARECWL